MKSCCDRLVGYTVRILNDEPKGSLYNSFPPPRNPGVELFQKRVVRLNQIRHVRIMVLAVEVRRKALPGVAFRRNGSHGSVFGTSAWGRGQVHHLKGSQVRAPLTVSFQRGPLRNGFEKCSNFVHLNRGASARILSGDRNPGTGWPVV